MKTKNGIIALLSIVYLFTACAESDMSNLKRGIRLFEQEKYDEAIERLTEAIRLNPNMAEAYAYRARAFNSIRDYDQGLLDANMAIELDPDIALGFFARGRAYQGKRDYDNAIADYTEAIRLDHNFVLAHNNRGNIFHDIKRDYDNAITDYTEAIRINPENADAFNNRGDALYRHALVEMITAINPDNLTTSVEDFENAMSGFENAIADLEEALRINPNHTNARQNLADVQALVNTFGSIGSTSSSSSSSSSGQGQRLRTPTQTRQIRHSTCNGSGVVNCNRCRGTGQDPSFSTDRSGNRIYRTCSSCGGSGRIRCLGCGGNGYTLGYEW